MRYLCVDFGLKRLGLAVSDENETLASAYAVRTRQGTRRDVADIIATMRGLGAHAIVFGLPRSVDETRTGDSEAAARRFAEALETALQEANSAAEFHWWDERFSTREAANQLRDAGVSQRQSREALGGGGIDARAAAVILQGFLDRRRSEREQCEGPESNHEETESP